ncbi:MAG: RNA-splicing ligase RtcB [Chlamydiae bacterium]|nr:RNA-splicing ligase RtcB [Chlamydiota bacterium]
MYNLKKIGDATYLLPQEGGMKVPGLIIVTEKLMEEIEFDRPLEQVRNVAFLPGIVGYSIAMPDIHWGYGFPIGGVAAMDAETGVISPGGVGYDINCGVRLAVIPEPFKSLSDKQKHELLAAIFKHVPSGIGRGHKKIRGLSDRDYKELIEQGARWSVEQGYGLPEDLEHIESNGLIKGGDPLAVSNHAKDRGRKQLGTVGSGNHFIEIGEVQKIFIPEIAEAWGIQEGQIYILMHSGSRGFGHQVCQDTLNTFVKQGFAEGLPDKQLVAAPINSEHGKAYFAAMAAAANFAFNNRQQIHHLVRQSFKEVLGTPPENIPLIYDVCHNIAKFEEYEIEGEKKTVCVHRKGATRAFGPGTKELAPIFRKTGQPVLVPGDMGRASHLMVGLGNPLTWCSSCHGAGRARSRVKSRKLWSGRDPILYMEQQGVEVMATSMRTITEEMPDAYKDVDAVVEAVQEAGLANMVARLRPHLVMKG